MSNLICPEAERHVLAAYLQGDLDRLELDWFGAPENKILAGLLKGERPTSREALAAKLVVVGMSSSLADIPIVDYDPQVLEQVKELALRRLLSVQVSEGIKRLALRGQGDLWAQVQEVLSPVEKLVAQEEQQVSLTPLVDWAQRYFQGEMYGYRTRWPLLDGLLGPLARERLFVLAGLQKVGKSIWALSLALDVATQGGKVVFNSLDMGVERTFLRLVSALTGIPFTRMWRKEMTSVEEHLLVQAEGIIKALPLSIVAVSGVQEFGRLSQGADMAVVDYLQLCTVASEGRRSKTEQVTAVVQELKAQSRDHFLLAVTQLSRGGDPYWTAAIEHDCDILGKLEASEEFGKRVVTLDVGLHRDGPTGQIPYYVFHEVERALEVVELREGFKVDAIQEG